MRVSRKWKTVDELNDYVVRLSGEEAKKLILILKEYEADNIYERSDTTFARELRSDLVRLRDKAGLW